MENVRRSPIPTLLIMAALIGGGYYFSQNFKVKGLDQLSVESRDVSVSEAKSTQVSDSFHYGAGFFDDAEAPAEFVARPDATVVPRDAHRETVTVLSWALDGFGPSKLANDRARQNLVRMIRQYDVIALQQIQAVERDIIPRLADALNEGSRRYDFAMGAADGPADQREQLAILFDTERVLIDRTQVYTIADPNSQMTFDPLVAWFQVKGPSSDSAWTFSLVNLRVNLSRAPAEVALLPGILSSVRNDGRGEDDVVMAGLFQADDTYLIRRVMGDQTAVAVRSAATDIFGRHQTCNIVMNSAHTSEYLGRGGPIDFLRKFNLSLSDAETLSHHLPVVAEFTSREGGL
ncbi:MAG: deoxyribonuclease I [Planctomycetota bacterium]